MINPLKELNNSSVKKEEEILTQISVKQIKELIRYKGETCRSNGWWRYYLSKF